MSRLKRSVKSVNIKPVAPINDESTADIFITSIVCTDLILSLSLSPIDVPRVEASGPVKLSAYLKC